MQRPVPWRYWLGLVALMALLQMQPELWWYQRDSGQLWRWWTAHGVHVSWIHWALNSIALVFLPLILPVSAGRLLSLLLLLPLWISCWLALDYPEVIRYAGLSGVLHGLYAAAALSSRPGDRRFAQLLLAGLMIKLAVEWGFGDLGTAQLIGQPVLTAAHRLGVLGALMMWILEQGGRKWMQMQR